MSANLIISSLLYFAIFVLLHLLFSNLFFLFIFAFIYFIAEWNSSNVVKATSVPDILLRAGRIVQPLVIPKNVKKAEKKIPEEGTVVKKMNRTITGNKKHKK